MKPPITADTIRWIADPGTPRAQVREALQRLSDADKDALILRLAKTTRRQTHFVDIANRVSDTLSLDVLIPRLMDVVTESLGAERSSLFLLDVENGELFSRVMQGNVMGEVRFPATTGIAGAVLASGQGVIIPDAYAEPLFSRDMDQRTGYRTRNLLCVPIRNRRQKVIGITQALNKRDGQFDEDDQQLLEALSQPENQALLDTVFVEGHTDSVPNSREMGNWGLSTYRAISLWNFWTDKPGELAGLKALRTLPADAKTAAKPLISVSGYADTRSTHGLMVGQAFKNDRSEDRRIDIRFTLVSSEKQSLEGLQQYMSQMREMMGNLINGLKTPKHEP